MSFLSFLPFKSFVSFSRLHRTLPHKKHWLPMVVLWGDTRNKAIGCIFAMKIHLILQLYYCIRRHSALLSQLYNTSTITIQKAPHESQGRFLLHKSTTVAGRTPPITNYSSWQPRADGRTQMGRALLYARWSECTANPYL